MSYKAVGFDYGGVIRGLPGTVFSAKAAQLLDVTNEEYKEAYYRHNKQLHRGQIDWPELWQLVAKDLNRDGKHKALIELSASNKFEYNQDMLELVAKVRSDGFKVGLLSNNNQAAADQMRRDNLPARFDAFNVSVETGFVKPESEAFKHLAQCLQVDIAELIFIDDSEKSLSTAKEVGYTPILHKSFQETVDQLSQLLGLKI